MIIKDLHEKFMRVALDEANASKHKGEWFGGAVVVKNGEIIAKAQNTVRSSNDPTAHSEINAIRKACKKLKTFDLQGMDLYTNVEPCPMCMTACIWANIENVHYGACIRDLLTSGDSQIDISSSEIVRKAFRKIGVNGGILKKECLEIIK